MNPNYEIVDQFEKTIAEYAGSKYAIAVESGTAAIFLCLQYFKRINNGILGVVEVPKRTYPSVPLSVIHAGGIIKWVDWPWEGLYQLFPFEVLDGALRFKKDMFHGGLHCLSFHEKKHLPIGRGGMILTNYLDITLWLKVARYDGREQVPLKEQTDILVPGFNMYMTPEQAKRGLELFEKIKDLDLSDLKRESQDYPDLSKLTVFKKHDLR